MKESIDSIYRCAINDTAVILKNIQVPKFDEFTTNFHSKGTYIPPTIKIIPVYDKTNYESEAYKEYTSLIEKFKESYKTYAEYAKNNNSLAVTADDLVGEGLYHTFTNLTDTIRTMLDIENLIDCNGNKTLIQMKKTKNQINLNYYYIKKAYSFLRSFEFIEESYLSGAVEWMDDCNNLFINGNYCCKLVKDMNPLLKDSVYVMNSLMYILLKIDYNSMVKTDGIDYIDVMNKAMTDSITIEKENYEFDCNSYQFISLDGIIAEANGESVSTDSDVDIYPVVHVCEHTNDTTRINSMGRIGDEIDLGNCASNHCSAYDNK